MFHKYKYFETCARKLFYQKKLYFFLFVLDLHQIIEYERNAKNPE